MSNLGFKRCPVEAASVIDRGGARVERKAFATVLAKEDGTIVRAGSIPGIF